MPMHFFVFLMPPHTLQMDPKLRPSFPDIVKRLEEIQKKLKGDESERERMLLTAVELDKKSLPKGEFCNSDWTKIIMIVLRMFFIHSLSVVVNTKCLLNHCMVSRVIPKAVLMLSNTHTSYRVARKQAGPKAVASLIKGLS